MRPWITWRADSFRLNNAIRTPGRFLPRERRSLILGTAAVAFSGSARVELAHSGARWTGAARANDLDGHVLDDKSVGFLDIGEEAEYAWQKGEGGALITSLPPLGCS